MGNRCKGKKKGRQQELVDEEMRETRRKEIKKIEQKRRNME